MKLTTADANARRDACYWHSGGSSPLYALCSTGAITEHALAEVTDCHDEVSDHNGSYAEQDGADLATLFDYIVEHGPRGPVDGWGIMPWPEGE